MSSAFVSKSRKVRFNFTLRILDLNNVPLVSGTSFIKWHLPSSTAAEHRGRTPKNAIKDHRVLYDYEKTLPVRLTVGKDGMLQEVSVHLEVVQEYSAGGKAERISLGRMSLNLAEYVEASEQLASPTSPGGAGHEGGEAGVVRRYLMQESKINSTLKLGIAMKYVEGTREYYAPPLRTAPVFGGIAGIISSSEPASNTHGAGSHAAGDPATDDSGGDNGGGMPSLNASNKEVGEMQDMYRRTLTAFWTSQPGELKADDCIEDIFAGGDGWGKGGRPGKPADEQSQPGSGNSTPNPDGTDVHGGGHPRTGKLGSTGRGIASISKEKYNKFGQKTKMPRKNAGEIDEFDVREDLQSWRVSEKAY